MFHAGQGKKRNRFAGPSGAALAAIPLSTWKIIMRSFFFIALVCLMAGCKKGGRDCALPSCMNTAIEQFKTKDMICDHGASVAEYKFQGQRVFVFDTGSCIADGLIVVKDISCN